jgi:Interferon-induced transmembrane protein
MSQNWTPPPAAGSGATVPNNMVIAIISIFCCWPLAIPAIIFASKVNNLAAAGDMAGAQEAAAKAKKFATIGIIVGVVCIVLWLILVFVFGIGGALLGGGR